MEAVILRLVFWENYAKDEVVHITGVTRSVVFALCAAYLSGDHVQREVDRVVRSEMGIGNGVGPRLGRPPAIAAHSDAAAFILHEVQHNPTVYLCELQSDEAVVSNRNTAGALRCCATGPGEGPVLRATRSTEVQPIRLAFGVHR